MMNFNKFSTALLATGIVVLSSCNKDMQDNVTTTNDNVAAIQSSLDNQTDSYDITSSGSTATVTVEAYNQTDNEKEDPRTMVFKTVKKSVNTITETKGEGEWDNEDYTFVRQDFVVRLYSNNGNSSAKEDEQGYVTFNISRYVNVDGISESDFEDELGYEEPNKAFITSLSYNFKDYSDNFDKWSANGTISTAGKDSYGVEIDNFEYNLNENNKISFTVETKNDDADDYDMELTGDVSSKIYYNIIDAHANNEYYY